MTLSDKKEYLPKDCYGNLGFDYFNLNDVKEAIKELKEEIDNQNVGHYDMYGEDMPLSVVIKLIDKIFGKELCS
jgi:hypothetical protein